MEGKELMELGGDELRSPQQILGAATERATLLKDIVQRTHSYLMIGEKEHLCIEAWMTIAAWYHCTARSTVEPIEIRGIPGWKAHGLVINEDNSKIVSEADAYCMEDEGNWEEKDLFQQASMAQTRAMSKALANKFRWVVVLAGYATTPAEEMITTKASYQFRFPFGDHKGKQPSDLTVEQLCEEQARFEQLVSMPNNKFKDANERLLKAIKVELDMRPAQAKGDGKLYEWILDQFKQLKPSQKVQAIGIMNTHTVKDNPKLSQDQRTALVDYFNEHWGAKE